MLPWSRPKPAPLATASRLPTGCAPLDALLGGGLETGTLTEVHGEAGTGKTNLALQLSREVALAGHRVLYLDTEGFSAERLAQLCGPALSQVQPKLFVEEIRSSSDQGRAVKRAARIARGAPDVKLVILDSATLLYRIGLADSDAKGQGERRELIRQLHELHTAARERGFAVLATNQVFSVPGQDGVHGLGGHGLRHLAATVVRLERDPAIPGARRATLVKHRSRPEGLAAGFRLAERGVEPLRWEAAPAAVLEPP